MFSSPRLPILVPTDPSETRRESVTVDNFLEYLSTRPFIDVHRYDKQLREDGGDKHPDPISGPMAVALFRDPRTGRFNFLNLKEWKQNAVAACCLGQRAYSILHDVTDSNDAGKATLRNDADLTACVGFMICGKHWVSSMVIVARAPITFCRSGGC